MRIDGLMMLLHHSLLIKMSPYNIGNFILKSITQHNDSHHTAPKIHRLSEFRRFYSLF